MIQDHSHGTIVALPIYLTEYLYSVINLITIAEGNPHVARLLVIDLVAVWGHVHRSSLVDRHAVDRRTIQ